MYRMQFLLMSVALNVGMVHSWDIATSTGDDLLRFYTNDILTSTISLASRNISALTFDEVHNTMLYVDKKYDNDSICGYDLTSIENKCFTEGSGRDIYGLAYDPATEQVFFTDTNDRSINWISLKPGSDNSVNLLIKVSEGIPRDIVVDSCKGYIYWLNTRLVAPTIERARLDGTEREVFEILLTIPVNATYNLEPNSLAIDQHKQRIYWMQPGTDKLDRLFTRLLNTKHTPFFIIWERRAKHTKVPSNTFTISKDSIFHIGSNMASSFIYSYTKVKSNETSYTNTILANSIIEKKSMYQSDRKTPISIVANYKIKDQIQDCEALRQVKLAIEMPFCVHGTKVNDQPACNCTPGYTGERCDVSVCDNYCMYGICSFNKGRPECRCNAGYSGERCQFSVCENFCMQGNCSFNDDGLPICRCSAGYSGERCHLSNCENHCMQGNCSFNDEGLPECRCNAGYSGERCQFSVCENFCMQGNCSFNDDGLPICRCSAGYSGERCHLSNCENHCMQGNCSFNDEGLPECRCNAGYTGERCEVNTCLGYCLNNGVCFLNEEDEPSCECAGGYEGTRCEANKNDTLTVLVSHHGKSSTYSFPVNCGSL